MLYSVDTNVLIDAWREWYAPTSHPTFWERLEQLAIQGKLKISDAVLWELEEVEDDTLTAWCKERENILCYPSVAELQRRVGRLGSQYPNFVNQKLGTKNFADPFVVALAQMHPGCSVVTHEKGTGNLNGPRIPDVCKAEDIRFMRLPRLVREEGWVFK